MEKQTVSMRPQAGSASEPAKASLPLSKKTVPAETHTAKLSKPLGPQAGAPNRRASMLVQAATPPPGPASVLPKQPSTARPILPASPCFQHSIPVPARTALTPLSTSAKSGKTPFKPPAASLVPTFAGRAVSSSPLTALTPKVLPKPLLSASTTASRAGTGNISSSQQRSARPSPGMSGLVPKVGVPSLVRSSGQPSGKAASPLAFKPTSLPQESAKPASKGTGAFPNLLQQPARTSGGGIRSAVSPGLGIAPLQAGVQSSLPTQSSSLAGLSQAPCTSKTAGMTRAAPSAGANPHKPVTQTASMHPNVSSLLGQGRPAIRDHHTTGSPRINQQAAQPAELSLQGNLPIAPKVQSQAGTRPAGPTADTVMEEEVHGRPADPNPWTSTSLAAGLMGNMRNLEEVIFHARTATVMWTI
ncbi:hypothetical protein ABBQ38_003023 [Trebouxia sp. C0009 RCD-2024]